MLVGMVSKEMLRNNLTAQRRQVSGAETVEASKHIATRVMLSVRWSGVKRIHIYETIALWHEIDTNPLIAAIQARYPLIIIVVGESKKNAAIPQEKFDVIIVPVLGFDAKNYRLGLGGGWYDRFLATQPQAQKLGLAYGWAKLDPLPNEPHDVPLDTVITD